MSWSSTAKHQGVSANAFHGRSAVQDVPALLVRVRVLLQDTEILHFTNSALEEGLQTRLPARRM